MAQSVALSDLVAPYLLEGQDLNAVHAALSVLHVVTHEEISDPLGVFIRGRAEFQGRLSIPGANGELFTFVNDETEPPFDPNTARPVFDLEETNIEFELFAPRAGSATIAAGVAALNNDNTFANARAVLGDWGPAPPSAQPTNYPGDTFTLDLIVNGPRYRPSFLRPARMTNDGLLQSDPTFREVAFTLPRLRFRLAQNVNGDGRLHFDLLPVGINGPDDPGDVATAEFVTMTPPYATIRNSNVGFGFRSATLDLSSEFTPPAVLNRIGVGDDWAGLYLPELRLFIGGGSTGFAWEVGARDLLIGLGENDGVSLDFEAAMISLGEGELSVGARFFDVRGRSYGLAIRDGSNATVTLPGDTNMVVDIQGGRVPYTSTVSIDGGAPQTGRLFALKLDTRPVANIVINVSDSSRGTPKRATLTIVAQRGDPRIVIVTGGTAAEPAKPATLRVQPNADPRIVIAGQDDRSVTLTTEPADSATVWTLDGGAPLSPRPSFTVDVAPGTTRTVSASLPAVSVEPVRIHFYFDSPPAVTPSGGAEAVQILAYARQGDNAWSTEAIDRLPAHHREPGGAAALSAAQVASLNQVRAATDKITITGQASYESDDSKLDRNFMLARRRAIAARELVRQSFGSSFDMTLDPPAESTTKTFSGIGPWTAAWKTHPSLPEWWRADISWTVNLNRPARASQGVLQRPTSASGEPPVIQMIDPPAPAPPPTPEWFRSARLKIRVIENRIIAVQVDGEFDIQTAAEEKIRKTGQAEGVTADEARTLRNGQAIGASNPGDGLIDFRFLVQQNETTDEMTMTFSVGADPSDTDGLAAFGWLPGETRPPNRNIWRNLVGSYLSFWPLLVSAADRDVGAPVNAIITGASLAIPGTIALLPWFRVERIILFGGEAISRWHVGGSEANLFFDIETAWSMAIPNESNPLLQIGPEPGIKIRYKAIGLRLADVDENGAPIQPRYELRPVFDSSRGYTLDLGGASGVRVRPPLDRILKVFAARMSRINPLTFEVEIGVGIDFGVVSFDRMGVRVHLDQGRPPELTAIGARVDIPGGIAGQGYLAITDNRIGGQIDVTVRPIGLRVAGSLEIANIDAAQGGPATGLYVGLELRLPVGIPLGSTGLGLYGFRGLFGMHYARTPIGADKGVPSLEWLKAAGGRPNLLANNGVVLWEPKIDNWSFGVGTMLGTMDGGIILNLDGTLLLDLPGPSIIIAMNARFLMPPPSMDQAGAAGGILAVIEITPEHIAIGIFATYEIKRLIKVSVPAEAFFATGDLSKWHFYLGARPDIADGPGPAIVDVLGIVQGTGYLMIRGDGLPPYVVPRTYALLPEVKGFGIGVGASASFTWGSTDIGLYVRVGGGFDAVAGFDPLLISAVMYVSGEIRLFVVSVGATASLHITVREQPDGSFPPPVSFYLRGEVCGHIDLFFTDISECVTIEIGSGKPPEPPIPMMVSGLSLKSRSPALVRGTGVDRPIDGSVGEAVEAEPQPLSEGLPVVPVDAIPVLAMAAPPVIAGAQFFGAAIADIPNLPAGGISERGGEKYLYQFQELKLERIAPDGSVMAETLLGDNTPCRWWTRAGVTGNPTPASLALFTWDLDPAAKAIESSDKRTETITERWGTVCHDAASPASVLWTFRLEPLGPSAPGWTLAGVARPDKPDTRRSEPADTTLRVREKWRTGRASIDKLRGIVPAEVIGGQVPCQRSKRTARTLSKYVRVGGRGMVSESLAGSGAAGWLVKPSDPLSRLLIRNDQLRSVRISETLYAKADAYLRTTPTRTQQSSLAALAQGTAVSRADVLNALSATGAAGAGRRPDCQARMLQSPMLDDGTPQRFGDEKSAAAIADALKTQGIVHGPLDNVVIVETGPFKQARLLLLVPHRGLGVYVRVLDAGGARIDEHKVDAFDSVPPVILPDEWTRPDGPWAADVTDVIALMGGSMWGKSHRVVLVDIGGGKKVHSLEIGTEPDPDGVARLNPFYLGAVELFRQSEIARYDHDSERISREREQVTELLGESSTDHAFLHPDSLYRCEVKWTGMRMSSMKSRAETQTFWFRTDGVAPPRVDSFVVMTTPAEGEKHYFGAEPPTIVFATQDIDRLYGAYNLELKVRLQASSGRHPPGQNGGASQVPITAQTLVNAGAGILSPFEDTLERVLEGQCIPIDVKRKRQTKLTIPVPLEPFTDYILDIVAVPKGTEPDQFTPFVLRRHFSTGGYGTLAQFAGMIGSLTIRNRGLASNATAANLGAFLNHAPQGEELDAALRRAGFDVSDAPRSPTVTIFWEGQQPTAVLIDSDSPLWRERPYPAKVSDPTSLPGTVRWQMQDDTWLSLVTAPGGDPIVNGAPIRGPGAQRALVLLKPGSRDKRLKLDLLRKGFDAPYLDIAEDRFPALDVKLIPPPWEQ